jgi:hypothetical protein
VVLPLELPPDDPPMLPEPLDDPPLPIDPPELPPDDPPELAPRSVDPGGHGLVPEASAPLLEDELPLLEPEPLLELPCLELSVDPGAQSFDAPLLLLFESELEPPISP